MQIKTGTFYKAKDTINGMKAPGGYFYVVEAAAGKVKFTVTEEKKPPQATGGTFTVDAIEFRRMIEQ